ncbi:MAG TPA: amidohydrolase family protein [Gemmatimonadaceae bacterium]|nr:amidohydrolase family protein [Gemmatimonadaceae bacterium]
MHDAARETISIDTHEGTMLGFDLAPDDSTIVFDLLGQLWTLPASGGTARAITDAVRDTAEDLDPSVSPDGRSIVFRAERRGRTGLWLLERASGAVRQLTQLGNPDEYNGAASWSPDGRAIAYTRVAQDSSAGARWHSRIRIIDVATGAARDVRLDTTQQLQARDPAWMPDGRRIVFAAASPASPVGGRLWMIDASGGRATPLSADSTPATVPAVSPDGRRIAFLARDTLDHWQVWVQDLAAHGARARLTSHDDVASTRVRWTRDGGTILYAADGQLRRVSARGGESSVIPFTAHLAITRARRDSLTTRLVANDSVQPARAYLGLALSPDGQRIAAIALGKLWVFSVGSPARTIADVPFTARGLAWSPDGGEVAWSAGAVDHEDLFAANTRTGAIRRVTALNGREALPAYSPDGRYIAFMHQDKTGALRIVDAHAAGAIDDTMNARAVAPGDIGWTRPVVSYPQWSPASDGLLIVGESNPGQPTTATVVRLNGARDTVKQFVDAPIFLHWGAAPRGLTFVRHDRLWRAAFDGRAVHGTAQPLGDDAALYASTANDGSVLYVSNDGLRLRSASGSVRRLGWPITYTRPAPAPLVIHNARIVAGSSDSASAPMDIAIEHGRVARIAAAGSIASSTQTIDATGKFVMPGLVDLHAHTYRPDLLPTLLYFGVTMVRDQGSSIGPLVAHGDAIAAGVFDGPRVSYGGFQFYSDWPYDEEQGRGLEPEADPGHVARSIGLAAGFGAQHVKTRTFRRWDVNARMIAEAHRLGMRATGHCTAPLPLIAAGMDAKEHIGMCSTRGAASPYAMNDMLIYDDEVQLFKAAHVAVVPTISYLTLAARVAANPKVLEADSAAAPFISPGDFDWMVHLTPVVRRRWERAGRDARATTARLARAGVSIGTGTDIWQLPTALHMELEELVAAGLSPAEAIRAATSSAARIIGVERDLGTIEPGKLADLVILDANPLTDIRNTRRIAAVIQGGRVVDRAGIRQSFAR